MTDLSEAISAPLIALEDVFARELPELTIPWSPQQIGEPALLAFNERLALELGLDIEALCSPAGLNLLAGAASPEGVAAVAMGYAGHQFGGYSPRLGDGRAALLGELVTADGTRLDLHLKGSGRTAYSRGGDGRATVGPMLREFLFAEAMRALGVPTTLALAVVTTGEAVMREQPEPGAVLTRVAASHLRVGSFEYAARLEDKTVLKRLADHAIARHYPDLADSDDPYVGLLSAVAEAQAALVSQWMLIGFIHGVLNTDNVLISGESIDFGPCAFMDRFDAATVFSSIDRAGRYAFGNQPSITHWNLTRLAETLIPLINDDFDVAVERVKVVLEAFGGRFHAHWCAGMRAKLGLPDSGVLASETEQQLFDDLLGLLYEGRVDYTSSFRALASALRGDEAQLTQLFGADASKLSDWRSRWMQMLGEGADLATVAEAMDAVNPIYIPRNHLVDEALVAATAGDASLFAELLAVITSPFVAKPGHERFAAPAPDEFNDGFQTFCGT